MKSSQGNLLVTIAYIALLLVSLLAVFFTPEGLLRSCWALLSFGIIGVMVWKRYFREYGAFDQVISGSYWKQIILLACIATYVLSSCVFSFMLAGIPQVSEETSTFSQIISVIHRIMDYNYYSGDEDYSNLFLLVSSILGTLILTGLLVTTFSNIIQQRKEDVENGLVSYNLSNHYVIVGYGDLALPFIKEIINKQLSAFGISLEDKRIQDAKVINKRIVAGLRPVVLLTNQRIDRIARDIKAHIPDQFDKKIFVYSGDVQSPEHLEKLNFDKAIEVYVLGEKDELGRDSINIECTRCIREMRQKAYEESKLSKILKPIKAILGKQIQDCKTATEIPILPVHIQLDKPTSYSTIKRLSFPKDYYGNDQNTVLYIRPFNFYENCARAIWGYRGENAQSVYKRLSFDSITKNSPYHVHLVIAGFDVMGKALLLEALRLCHYVNYDEKTSSNKTIITIIDPKIDALWNEFIAQYQGIDNITDIEIERIPDVIESPSVRKKIETLANTAEKLLTIAICFYDADYSFCAALNLPDAVFYKIEEELDSSGDVISSQIVDRSDRVSVLVRQQLQKGISDIIQHRNLKYKNLYIFGTIEQGVNASALDDTPAMWVSAFYDFKYQDKESEKYSIISEFENLDLVKSYLKEFEKETFDGYDTSVSILDFALENDDNYNAIWPFVQRLWYLTSEDIRFSNRYQVDAYDNYHAKGESDFPIEDLYRMEHLRWCADRIITGYKRYDSLKKLPNRGNKDKFEFKLHNLIMPYSDLHAAEKTKDADVIINREKIISLSMPRGKK